MGVLCEVCELHNGIVMADNAGKPREYWIGWAMHEYCDHGSFVWPQVPKHGLVENVSCEDLDPDRIVGFKETKPIFVHHIIGGMFHGPLVSLGLVAGQRPPQSPYRSSDRHELLSR